MVTVIQPGNGRREVAATTISLGSVKRRFACSVFGKRELRFPWPFECVGVVSETDVTELTLLGNTLASRHGNRAGRQVEPQFHVVKT